MGIVKKINILSSIQKQIVKYVFCFELDSKNSVFVSSTSIFLWQATIILATARCRGRAYSPLHVLFMQNLGDKDRFLE